MQEIICTIDGVSFRMKESYDFSFLKPYGRVFRVYDDQDSGNICFGTQRGGERFFIKYAGAPTLRGSVPPSVAAATLQRTVPVYQALKHKNLIELLETFSTTDGFGMVFRWTDARCMGRQYPEDHRHFMAMDASKKLAVFTAVQQFMAHVHERGYAAIDFYDGSIMYDFSSGQTVICDIDFFRPKPCVNDMGRMWGSSRFQAPEEYQLGAAIDERTNVYTLGAVAFALFGAYSRALSDWTLNEKSFSVVSAATDPDPRKRQQTIRQLMDEWQKAL